MSNEAGHQITALTLWVAGALGAALWAILFALLVSGRESQAQMQDSLTTLITSQKYDRREIDAIHSDIGDVRQDVRNLTDRVVKVEAKR